jgi:hypothetical protein
MEGNSENESDKEREREREREREHGLMDRKECQRQQE